MLDDAAVIAQSWQQPERFAVLFDRHAAADGDTRPDQFVYHTRS